MSQVMAYLVTCNVIFKPKKYDISQNKILGITTKGSKFSQLTFIFNNNYFSYLNLEKKSNLNCRYRTCKTHWERTKKYEIYILTFIIFLQDLIYSLIYF